MSETPDLTPDPTAYPVDGVDGVDDGVRRHPSTIGGAVYLVVLAATVGGLIVVALGHWRTGIHWVAGALLTAAAMRLVLRRRDAGMLAVRSRLFDAGLLAAVGTVLWFLASTIPDRPV